MQEPTASTEGQGQGIGDGRGFWLFRAGEGIAALCAALALAGIMFLMLFDVTGRYLFNSPVPGAAELIELGMGIVVFAALPLVTARNEHIRLDYFDQMLGGRLRPLIRALVDLFSGGVMAMLAWRIVVKTETVIRYGDSTPFLRFPVSPVAIFMSVCAILAAVVFIYLALRSLWAAILGHRAAPRPQGGA